MKIPYSALLFVIAVTVTVLVIMSSTAVSAAGNLVMEEEPVHIPNENEVKKMKVKELKVFLADRGVACEACTEKGDFSKKVLENLQTPLLPSKRKLKPKGEFWEFWATLSQSVCSDAAAKKGNVDDAEAICSAVGSATDTFFMQHGKRTANKLKKKPANLLKTSVGEPYQGAGRRLIGKLVQHCLTKAGACASASKVSALLEGNTVKNVDFQKWITNVGIENTNPMYETMKDKSMNSDL